MGRYTWKKFALDHLWAVLALGLIAIYLLLAKRLPIFFSECLTHRFLHLYCPLCGGTRAVGALLRFHVTEALRYNAWVVLSVGVALIWYLRAWVRFLWRKREQPWRLHRGFLIAWFSFFIAFGIARNLLMIVWRIDPIGELMPFWNGR